ncbi:MAG: hypothetical protein KatS3mg012_0671 [Gaiellaceae bacterium]|nr:MAG: hypothetical protein KatS3mg012_0671 [Gaiellaceae bacterium]
MKRVAAAMLIVLAVPAAATASSAGQVGASATTVRTELMEWMVMPSKSRVPAGKVTFVVTNSGKLKHDFVVLRTNLAPGKLPIVGARAKELGRVGRTPVFGPKQTRKLTLTLKAGRYVLICNVPAHYMAGMRVAFRVGG